MELSGRSPRMEERGDEISPDAAVVRRHLERILISVDFSVPNRVRNFLRFVVEETLSGGQSKLKAYTIAVAVFDRAEDFDSMNDPVVRIEAGRLRRALERYYLLEGKSDAVIIELTKGSYVPTFRWRATPSPEPIALEPAQLQPTSATKYSHSLEKLRMLTSKPRFAVCGLVLAFALNLAIIFTATRDIVAFQSPEAVPSHEAEVILRPFVSLSPDTTGTAFAAGLSDETLTRLARINRIKVFQKDALLDLSNGKQGDALPTSARRYVLEGSVRQSGDKLRIVARLIDSRTAAVKWADAIEGDLRGAPNMETAFAAELADLVAIQMTPPPMRH